MQSLWNDNDAAQFGTDLELRVYTSRLLGRDPALVLHGGGNTSVKVRQANLVGEDEDILYVKGSGWDLATIEAAGFAPVRQAHLLKLAKLEALADSQMVNELKTNLTDASAPGPSVETILHAALPFKFVDHTHADAVVTITNTADGEARIRQLYGDDIVLIPYVMPGFDLARLVAERFAADAHAGTVGMVLMNHGVFSFANTAKESYERMIALVSRAEDYLAEQGAWELPPADSQGPAGSARLELAALRHDLSQAAGRPVVVSTHATPEALAFARRDDLATVAQQGPATPDHVIRTKRLPLLGRDLAAYEEAYQAYFGKHAAGSELTMLDPAPRVVLDPEFGLLTVGRSIKDANIVADIYRHTMQVIQRAERLGGYRALPASDIFAVEYWELEQAKLRKAGDAPPFQGEVALVTGAASGIGKACVEAFLEAGAAVIGLDLNAAVEGMFGRADFLGLASDVADAVQLEAALEAGVRRFGGLDMLVLNAGIFPGSCAISELTDQDWRRVMAVNLDANLALMRLCHPLLALAPATGRVVVIGSKNVPAPGPGAAAYSASKAALNQLARVAALEWGADRIRINTLHPNGVFDTAIWTPELLAARAESYGISVAEYKAKNILKTEVRSCDVADLAAAMCGPLFSRTTAAQVPIDGGNDRVI